MYTQMLLEVQHVSEFQITKTKMYITKVLGDEQR